MQQLIGKASFQRNAFGSHFTEWSVRASGPEKYFETRRWLVCSQTARVSYAARTIHFSSTLKYEQHSP